MAADFDLKPHQGPAAGARGNEHTQRTYRERRVAATVFHAQSKRTAIETAPKRWGGLRAALNDLDRALRGELKLEEGDA